MNNNAVSGGGNIGIGNNTPSSKLTIDGSSFPQITALTVTGTYLGLGTYNSTNLLFDNNSLQTKTNATTA